MSPPHPWFFLPLDGSLKTSNVVLMYENLEHHMKGDFMRIVQSSQAVTSDAVEMTDLEGKSVVFSDFLSK